MGSFFSKKFEPDTDLPDLKGKVVIVTGANTGIGYHTVKHLASKGAKVYLAARNESKATAAIAQLEAEGLGPGLVEWLYLDLSDPRKAKAAAEAFLKKETRLDILVNNAGAVLPGCGKTDDGIQETMMVNHISPFIFTETLLPLLKSTAELEGSDVRIVNLSSGAHLFVPAANGFKGVDAFNETFETANLSFLVKYGFSKLANVVYAKDLQRQMDSLNIPMTCLSVEPGGVRTDAAEGLREAFPWILRPFYKLMTITFFAPQEKGAYTSVFAAAAPIVKEKPEIYKGAYLSPVAKIGKPLKKSTNPELASDLRNTTESILKDLGVL